MNKDVCAAGNSVVLLSLHRPIDIATSLFVESRWCRPDSVSPMLANNAQICMTSPSFVYLQLDVASK